MKRYLIIFTLLLIIEIAIAYFEFNWFVRGFLGDVLVIPLLYTLLRTCTKLSERNALILVLLAAFGVEFLQLFYIAERLNIQNKAILLVLGDTFDIWDLAAYLLGIIPVLAIDGLIRKK